MQLIYCFLTTLHPDDIIKGAVSSWESGNITHKCNSNLTDITETGVLRNQTCLCDSAVLSNQKHYLSVIHVFELWIFIREVVAEIEQNSERRALTAPLRR